MKFGQLRKRKINFCIYIILLTSILLAHPTDKIICNCDYWVNRVESSKNKCISSSTLKTQGNINYSVGNLFDNDKNTCWCPEKGTKGDGLQEFIIFKIPYKSKGLIIINGLATNDDLFYKNNRVKRIYLGWISENIYNNQDVCSTKNNYGISFQTSPNDKIILKDNKEAQNINFSDPKINLSWSKYDFIENKDVYLILAIESIYYGTKYRDTCISEIKVIK